MTLGSFMTRAVVVLGCLYVCSSMPRKKAVASQPQGPARLMAVPAQVTAVCPPALEAR